MNVNPVVSPVYLLRSYIWLVLKVNNYDVWNEENYGNKIPIVPLGEEPDLDEFDGPHIVYGYALDGDGTLYARNSGSMTLVIHDQNFRRLTQTMNTLKAALGRFDDTARDINKYTSTVDYYRGLSFGYIATSFSEGGAPAETEGGRQSAILNIRFDYFVDYDVATDVTRYNFALGPPVEYY